MYLMSQLWWLLFMAFLLGLLFGYLTWKLCSQRRSERALAELAEFRRDRSEGATRLTREAEATAEAVKKHSDDLRRARDDSISALSAERKKLDEIVKSHAREIAAQRQAELELRQEIAELRAKLKR